MIVSHEHRFIFLKTKKTAGTSLELALRPFCGDCDIISPIMEDEEGGDTGERGPQNWKRHSWWRSKRPLDKRRWFRRSPADFGFYNHMPAIEAKALLSDDQAWNGYFKFAFERNPWDRQVSHFYYQCRKKPDQTSFAKFMQGDRRARLNNFEIYSLDGVAPCVDFLGRYEHLETDLGQVLTTLGLSLDRPLPQAKATQRTSKSHYRSFYDDRTKATVADWYAREIALLEYRF